MGSPTTTSMDAEFKLFVLDSALPDKPTIPIPVLANALSDITTILSILLALLVLLTAGPAPAMEAVNPAIQR